MTLETWLRENGKQKREFAAEIGVTPQMISAYLKGDIWPSRERMRLIAEKTGGAVTANDFVSLEAQ
jgi:3,4-dihydroxy 2-butanone 4-phosphate synthase/GTP cyclohydrolase II